MLRRGLAIAFAIAAIAIGSPRSAAAVSSVERSIWNTTAQSELVALINAYRTSHGRQAASPNGALAAAAAWMASDMAARNYVGHVSSDGLSPTQRMSAFGYPATAMYTGEDLGAGYGTTSAVLAGWQASPAHNAVLLNPNYNAIGIGLSYEPGSTYKWYWAADFGGPGGTVRVIAAPAPEPQPVPRGSVSETTQDTVDRSATVPSARIAFVEELGARRIAHLIAVLLRMGAI